MKEKVFKTLDEQIEILEKKNLKIDDVDYADIDNTQNKPESKSNC